MKLYDRTGTEVPPSRKFFIYVSGPITPTAEFPSAEENSKRFYTVTRDLFVAGFSVYCPRQAWVDDHPDFEREFTTHKYGNLWEEMLLMDEEIIRRADALYMLKGWMHSKGAVKEHNWALHHPKMIFYE